MLVQLDINNFYIEQHFTLFCVSLKSFAKSYHYAKKRTNEKNLKWQDRHYVKKESNMADKLCERV